MLHGLVCESEEAKKDEGAEENEPSAQLDGDLSGKMSTP